MEIGRLKCENFSFFQEGSLFMSESNKTSKNILATQSALIRKGIGHLQSANSPIAKSKVSAIISMAAAVTAIDQENESRQLLKIISTLLT